MNKFKKSFDEETMNEQLDARNNEVVQNVRNFAGLLGTKPLAASGPDIPQTEMRQPKMDLRPRKSILAESPVNNPMVISEQNAKIDAADKARQMKDLEDLENIGAFEEPDSEANMRAKKLRSILGLK